MLHLGGKSLAGPLRHMEAVMLSAVLQRVPLPAPVKVGSPPGLKGLALAGAALLATVGAGWYATDWWHTGRFIEVTDDAYAGGNVTAVSPHVAGFVADILVGDNQHVEAGQFLVRLDNRDFAAALGRAKAAVAARLAALDGLEAKLVLQQAMVRQAEAELASKTAAAGFASADEMRYR